MPAREKFQPTESSRRVDAIVGSFKFDDDMSDPAVDVTQQFNVASHNLLTSETRDTDFGVQVMGRQPATITISGVVRDDDLDRIEAVETYDGPVYVKTERWTGSVLVTSVTRQDRRERTSKGYWLYDVTVKCSEIAEAKVVDGALVHTSLGDVVEDLEIAANSVVRTAESAGELVEDTVDFLF